MLCRSVSFSMNSKSDKAFRMKSMGRSKTAGHILSQAYCHPHCITICYPQCTFFRFRCWREQRKPNVIHKAQNWDSAVCNRDQNSVRFVILLQVLWTFLKIIRVLRLGEYCVNRQMLNEINPLWISCYVKYHLWFSRT